MKVKFKPTDMQKKAIDADGSVLVSAAAGSGKTAVLVERVIRKLTDKNNPVSADRLLIVTFTNAAAAEMRSRIENRLFEECQKHPEDIGLLKQKHLIACADICTIDSFCINIVRDNFEKCGVEPDFQVSDGSDLVETETRVISDIINRHIAENSDDWKKLLDITGCEYDEKNLVELVEKIYNYSQQLPFPENFFKQLILPYEIPFDKNHPWYAETMKNAKQKIESLRDLVEKLAECSENLERNTEKCAKHVETLALLCDSISDVINTGNWTDIANIIRFANIPRKPSTYKTDAATVEYDRLNDNAKAIIEKLQQMFAESAEKVEIRKNSLYPAIKILIDIISEYGAQLLNEYKKANTLTFSDTEQMTFSLLCGSENGEMYVKDKAAELSERYDEVLVDEFQDVNDLQNMIFHIISDSGKKLFIVGDVKQSIYGFRGSNPDNFLNKKKNYTAIETASETDKKKIILSDNFRSKSGICEYANFVFSLIMNGEVGAVLYNSEERLNAAAKFAETDAPTVEIIAADRCDDEESKNKLDFEACCIAEYIQKTMNEGPIIHTSDGTLRNARYSDFMILLGTVKDKAVVIAKELLKRKIPVEFTPEGFFDSVEISVFRSLLKVISNPQSDVELLTVMMSPIFAFTSGEMADIRSAHPKGSLYAAVVSAAEKNEHIKSFIDTLSKMRKQAAMLPFDKLILKLFIITDYLNIVSAMEGGKIKCANLQELQGIAINYCASGRDGIGGFVRYLEKISENSIKANVSAGDNCVKMSSMHKSKGLQFPICILANLATRINNKDSTSSVIFSDKNGICFKYYDYDSDEKIPVPGYNVISESTREKTIEEKMRLLYVAMTRAEDRLVLVCTSDDMSKAITAIAPNISDVEPRFSGEWLKKTNSMSTWVLASALLHPDAQNLRDLCDINVVPVTDNSHIKVTVMNTYNSDISDSSDEEKVMPDEHLENLIRQNISYSYPFEALKNIAAKSSVSAIANKAESDRFAYTSVPSFMVKDGLSAAGRGTAMHHIMQFISMDSVPDINAEIERLAEWQYITENEAKVADRKALEKFFSSPLFSRISASDDVRREMRFLTEIPAGVLDNSIDSTVKDTPVIVQGAVDLCFAEDDGIVVVDFKTDRVDDAKQLAESYGDQLDIYAKACEKIFLKKVKERIIYSFHLSEETVL